VLIAAFAAEAVAWATVALATERSTCHDLVLDADDVSVSRSAGRFIVARPLSAAERPFLSATDKRYR